MARRTAEALRSAGFDAQDVREIELGDASDAEILAHAQSSGRAVVTRDTDFGELAQSSVHAGVVLLRVGDMRSEAIIARLLGSLRELAAGTADFSRAIVVIERARVRIRGSPESS